MKTLITLILSLVATTAMAQATKKAPAKKAAPAAQTVPADAPSQPYQPAQGTRAGNNKFARNYGLAGCGLGSVIIDKRGAQIFASTTNGTFSNQMTGISAGSLNCIDSASSEVAGRMDQFILVNKDQLQGDIAKGSGETIEVLADVMGCQGNKAAVGAALKNNYNTIFDSNVPANEITDSIISTIKVDGNLSSQCKKLS
ncbi:MAG: DUF3015 family protein [Bdellovibrio sp.]|nr:DUF3015 family protein [Bdellovibrio sp.]